jgi:hypothetical protein
MNRSSCFIFMLLLFNADAFSRTSTSFFNLTFGDSGYVNSGSAAIQLQDGSIYFAGFTDKDVIGGYDISLSRLDQDGNLLWTNYYGTIYNDQCARMIFDSSRKSIILCGQYYDTTNSITGALLLSVDTSGNQQWLRQFNSSLVSESFSGLTKSVDGGYIACGFQGDSASAGNNFLLVKTDSLGIQQWTRIYGDPDNNEVSDAVLQLADGNILLSGDKQMSPSKYNAYLIKTDSGGNFTWDLIFSNHNNGGCKSIMVDSNNDILVIGEAATDSSLAFDIQLCKADQNGNLKWLKYIEASDESDAGFSIREAQPGYYILTGYYYDTTSAGKKIVMMLTDSSGVEQSRKLFGSSSINIGYDIEPSAFGGYLIAGTDLANGKYYLIYDDISIPVPVKDFTTENFFEAYPSPASNRLTIKFTDHLPIACLELFNATGSAVYSNTTLCTEEIILNLENLQPGLYFLRATSDQKKLIKKIILN